MDVVRGALVAVEGIDGAGKTTQVRRLAEALRARGREVVVTKEPTEGPDGRRLRESAKTGRLPPEQELELFLADRARHVAELIRPAMARGAVVIVDRYYYSTAAYQGARGLDPVAIVARNVRFAPVPDVAVLLVVPPEVGVGRVRGRDGVENLFEREEDLRRCAAIFDALELAEIVRIQGDEAPDGVSARVLSAVLPRLGMREDFGPGPA